MHEVTAKNPGELKGISAKTNDIHHGKLYAGYVNKRNEVEKTVADLESADLEAGNQIYSRLRGLKEGETFAANGMILHERFFSILGGDGLASGALFDAITKQWGSYEKFVNMFTACGMAARGWAILAYDWSDRQLHIYTADAQNHGGVWGTTPLIPLDVYEHAYFLDFGADRKTYIGAFLANLNWDEINTHYLKIVK